MIELLLAGDFCVVEFEIWSIFCVVEFEILVNFLRRLI